MWHEFIVSSIVFGLVILLFLHGQFYMLERNYQSTLNISSQRNAAFWLQLIVNDFRKIGHLYDPPREAIQVAEPHRIEFYGDVDLDGVVELVKYQLLGPETAPDSPNPNDRVLLRQIDGEPEMTPPLGVTEFDLTYYNSDGEIAQSTYEITSIRIHLSVESSVPFPDSGLYGHSEWYTQITPKSIARVNW